MLNFPFFKNKPYTVLSLNYYLPKYFEKIWNNANLRVAADGGANRVHNFFLNKGNKNYKVPSIIAGDFDSIKNDVKTHLLRNGSQFIKTIDQDYSDVQKTLKVISKINKNQPICIVGGYGGRFDQTIGVINAALWFTDIPVYLFDDHNIMTWFRPENKGIFFSDNWINSNCSILPFGYSIKNIITKGLKYNLSNSLELGSKISISNQILDKNIIINTTDPFLWINNIPTNFNFNFI